MHTLLNNFNIKTPEFRKVYYLKDRGILQLKLYRTFTSNFELTVYAMKQQQKSLRFTSFTQHRFNNIWQEFWLNGKLESLITFIVSSDSKIMIIKKWKLLPFIMIETWETQRSTFRIEKWKYKENESEIYLQEK